jgi:WD40 repeat protein
MVAGMNEVSVYMPGAWDDPVRILEAPSANRAEGQPNWITVRFDPSGDRLLLADRDGSAQLWDVAAWDTINDDGFDEFDIGIGTWSDDGSIVATAATDGSISIRDGETFEVIRTMSGLLPAQIIDWMELSADGSLLLTALSGDIRLWDVASGQQIGVDFPHESSLAAAGGNHDETALRLVTATETRALVWNLDTDTWADVACRAAGSNLTSEEWSQWGPRDTERYAICPDYPLLD